jgi:hypothetical protein
LAVLLNQHRTIKITLHYRPLLLVYFQILLAISGRLDAGLRVRLGGGEFEVVGLAQALIIRYLSQCTESLLFHLGVMGFLADQREVAGDVLGTKILRISSSTIYHLRIIICSLCIDLM